MDKILGASERDLSTMSDFRKQIADARQNVAIVRTFGGGGTLLDLGANIGEVSIRCADMFDCIVAVEAHPDTTRVLLQRIWDADLAAKIITYNAVVAVKSGVSFFVSSPSEYSTGATARRVMRLKDRPKYYREVNSISLRYFIGRYRPRCIKMDIEGSEWDCLLDERLSLKGVKHLVVEFHGLSNPLRRANLGNVERLMARWGLHIVSSNLTDGWSNATLVFGRSKFA